MKIRVCFSKFGMLRFLGHLDVMRYFQHAIARASLPIAYSAGFHPHMILSFAQPLALSVTSDGEYFDCELTENVSAEELKTRLQNAMCDGFEIRTVTVLPPQEPNTKKQTGMSQIAGAMYLCEETLSVRGLLTEAVEKLGVSGKAVIQKPTKNGTKDMDVRAGIHAVGIVSENGTVEYVFRDGVFDVPQSLNDGFGRERSAHAAHTAGLSRFLFAVDAGSGNNISVELISEALRSVCELPEGRILSAHRMELYGCTDNRMVSLAKMK